MDERAGRKVSTWVVLAAVAAVFAVTVLGVPARSLFVFAAVLACPLSMLFMHGAHGGHGEHAGDGSDAQSPPWTGPT